MPKAAGVEMKSLLANDSVASESMNSMSADDNPNLSGSIDILWQLIDGIKQNSDHVVVEVNNEQTPALMEEFFEKV